MLQLTVTTLLTMVVLSSDAGLAKTSCGPCECHPDGVLAYWPDMYVAACKKELNLSTVPHNLPADIQGLRIYGGSISKITKWQFKSYRELLIILIENNKISQLEQGAFQFLTKLTAIELWFNSITVLPDDLFTYTPNLLRIYLEENKIKHLQTNLFRDLKYLKKVALHNNEITTIQENCFVNVPQLEEIKLYGNKLVSLDIKFIDKPNSLNALYLDMNPWHCDSYLYSVMAYVVNGEMWHERPVPTCRTSKNFVGLPWSTQLQTYITGRPKSISNTNNVIEGHDLDLKCKYHTPSRLLCRIKNCEDCEDTSIFITVQSKTQSGFDFRQGRPKITSNTNNVTEGHDLELKCKYHTPSRLLCRIKNCEDCEAPGIFVTVQSKTQSGFDSRKVVHIPPSVTSRNLNSSRHGHLHHYYTIIPATDQNSTPRSSKHKLYNH